MKKLDKNNKTGLEERVDDKEGVGDSCNLTGETGRENYKEGRGWETEREDI